MNGTPLDYLRGRYQEGRLIPFSGAGTPRSAVELLAAMGIDISDRHWVALAIALLESWVDFAPESWDESGRSRSSRPGINRITGSGHRRT
jgi:hypothetical protein